MRLHPPYLLVYASILASYGLSYLLGEPTILGERSGAILGGVFVLAGVLLGVWAKDLIKQADTALSPYGTPTALIVSGPFQFSRNPMYLSYVLIALGFGFIFHSLFALLPPILYAMYLHTFVIDREERVLLEIFGEHYLAYKKRVPRWL